MKQRLLTVIRAIWIATRFLTRIPLPDVGGVTAIEHSRAALAYPIVGLLLGIIIVAIAELTRALPPAAAAFMITVTWVWLTGALHLDGLADCADAWVGGLGSRERTLTILHDPHCGSMGVTAIVLALLGKWAGLNGLMTGDSAALIHCVWVPLLARTQILLLALTTPAATPSGLGATLKQHLPRRGAWLVIAIVISAMSAVLLPSAALLFGGIALVVFISWRASILHRLGGFTGDTAGALVEMSEIALLFGCLFINAG